MMQPDVTKLLKEAIANLDPALARERHDRLERCLNALTPGDRLIIGLRFGLYEDEPLTTQEICERLALAEDEYKSLERAAIQHLLEASETA